MEQSKIAKWLLPVSQSSGRVLAVSSLSCRHSKISQWVSITYGLYAFQSGVFVLVSRLSECVNESFKSGFSFPFTSIVFLEIFPVGFQIHVFWGLFSPMQDLRAVECLLSLWVSTVPCCRGSIDLVSRSPSEGIITYVVVDLLGLREEVSSGFSYMAILNPVLIC